VEGFVDGHGGLRTQRFEKCSARRGGEISSPFVDRIRSRFDYREHLFDVSAQIGLFEPRENKEKQNRIEEQMRPDPTESQKKSPSLMLWEKGIMMCLENRDGSEVEVELTWNAFQEMLRLIVIAVEQIPDEKIRESIEREWGKKYGRPDLGSFLDRIEDQRNTRRF
jgi:hypothetical protein